MTFTKSNSFQVADPGLEPNGQVPCTSLRCQQCHCYWRRSQKRGLNSGIHSLLLKGKQGDNTKAITEFKLFIMWFSLEVNGFLVDMRRVLDRWVSGHGACVSSAFFLPPRQAQRLGWTRHMKTRPWTVFAAQPLYTGRLSDWTPLHNATQTEHLCSACSFTSHRWKEDESVEQEITWLFLSSYQTDFLFWGRSLSV